jgi:hypothetical protein
MNKSKIVNPLDVYRKLPQTNCGKCSARTCMSFAVKALRRDVLISECPELSEKARQELEGMLPETGDWKERRLHELFEEVAQINFTDISRRIGATVDDEILKLKYMGNYISLSRAGFEQELDIMDKLLILTYVKQAGTGKLSDNWVAFRDLKDGMIRSEGFHGACEIALSKIFEHNESGVISKLNGLDAERVGGFSADLSFIVYVLPNIPFLILLWKGDEDFGPDCKILLDSSAVEFLDIEALLYLGMALVRNLK